MIYIIITITIILALLAILFIKYKKLEDLENAIITCEENLEYQLKEKNEIIKILIKEINDEDELYDLCIDNGWNLQWYEKYKKHLNKWTSY